MSTRPTKRPSDSLVEKTEIVLPSDANNLGTVFGGKIMSWIDIGAAISAGRHSRRPAVTASMDDLHFLAPIKAGYVVVLRSQVVYAGRTSMEVEVLVDAEEPTTGARTRCCTAWLTFVALDDSGKPTEVPGLVPVTPEEKAAYAEAERRRGLRLKRRGGV